MNSAERRLASDPIIMAALSARGLEVADLPWEQIESKSGDEVILSGRGQPSIMLRDDGQAILRWHRPEGIVSYTLDDEGGILTIHNTTTPDTMLDAMAGKRLLDVVDMPGAETMRIVCAVNSKAFVSDPLDTRIQVEPLREAGRDAITGI